MSIQEEHMPEVIKETPQPDGERRLRDKANVGAAALAFAFQQSPANEMTRIWVGTNVLHTTGSPVLTGVGVGLATFAIEGVSASSIGSALRSYPEKMDKIKVRLTGGSNSERSEADPEKRSLATDTALALGVGSGALVVKRHFEEQDRTATQDTKTIAKSAAGISIFSAGIATLASGGIEKLDRVGVPAETTQFLLERATDWKTYAAALAIVESFRYMKNKVKKARKEEFKEVADVDKKTGYQFGLIKDPAKLEKAAILEQDVWNKKGYGSLDGYKDHIEHARTFAAFDENGECKGLARLFGAGEVLPPFLEMEFYDEEEKKRITKGCEDKKIEELGTLAKEPRAPFRVVAASLQRLAYRDAIKRGVQEWGIIMEPERVSTMNEHYGFTFRQVGPTEYYQGGDCAPHIMSLKEVDKNMRKKFPLQYLWFTRAPLRRHA
jgi:hypothetical protein